MHISTIDLFCKCCEGHFYHRMPLNVCLSTLAYSIWDLSQNVRLQIIYLCILGEFEMTIFGDIKFAFFFNSWRQWISIWEIDIRNFQDLIVFTFVEIFFRFSANMRSDNHPAQHQCGVIYVIFKRLNFSHQEP